MKRTLLGGVRQCGYWPYLKAGLAGHSTALESLFTISNLPNLSSDPARYACTIWMRIKGVSNVSINWWNSLSLNVRFIDVVHGSVYL